MLTTNGTSPPERRPPSNQDTLICLRVSKIPLINLSLQGCAVLYVDKAHQDVVKPLVLSWGDGLGLSPEFGWQGKIAMVTNTKKSKYM